MKALQYSGLVTNRIGRGVEVGATSDCAVEAVASDASANDSFINNNVANNCSSERFVTNERNTLRTVRKEAAICKKKQTICSKNAKTLNKTKVVLQKAKIN